MRPPDLSKIVRERMEARGMTAYRLAQLTKTSRQTVGTFLSGDTAIRSDKLAKMFGVLGLIVVPAEEKE